MSHRIRIMAIDTASVIRKLWSFFPFSGLAGSAGFCSCFRERMPSPSRFFWGLLLRRYPWSRQSKVPWRDLLESLQYLRLILLHMPSEFPDLCVFDYILNQIHSWCSLGAYRFLLCQNCIPSAIRAPLKSVPQSFSRYMHGLLMLLQSTSSY